MAIDTPFEVALADGQLTLGRAGTAWLQGGIARVELSDGTRFTTAGGEVRREADGTWVVTARHAVTLVWRIALAGDRVRLRLAIENPQAHDLAIERLDVLVADFAADPASLALLQAGYQSWSYATPLVPLAQALAPVPPPVSGAMLPATEAERFVSAGMAVVRAGEREWLAGFTGARVAQPYVAVQPGWQGYRLAAACGFEGCRVSAGGRLESEELLLIFAHETPDALDAYAREVAGVMGARRAHAPTGWCSWYHFFTEVTEVDMRRNLDVLDAHRARLPVEVVQLDDGYQTAIGDWLSINEKFPSGLKALVDAIHARGYQAGIWLAPFFAGEPSRLATEYPDWLVRDEAGLPINTLDNWGHRNFSLDTTHPGVEAYLREVFHTIVDDWGFDYLKIDFLYAGAVRGRRHDPDATGLEAYRRGLAIIREVAGERFILGCGAPFLPSVGLVDGMRVGPDTAPDWSDPDPRGTPPALQNAIRSTLAHHWMHPHWWVNDPDCLIVRRGESRLTEAEVRSWATVVALSGGMVLFSDDLARLEPERAAILPRVLPPLGVAARPLGPYVDGMPSRLWLDISRPWGAGWLVACFNWTDAPALAGFAAADWPGLPAGPHRLFDVWTGELAEPMATVPAHGVRLLVARPLQAHPQLAGTTLTLYGGATEVADVRWDGRRLDVELACPGEHEGEVVVAVPRGWRLVEAPVGAIEGPGHARVPLVVRDAARVWLEFDLVGDR